MRVRPKICIKYSKLSPFSQHPIECSLTYFDPELYVFYSPNWYFYHFYVNKCFRADDTMFRNSNFVVFFWLMKRWKSSRMLIKISEIISTLQKRAQLGQTVENHTACRMFYILGINLCFLQMIPQNVLWLTGVIALKKP